MSASLGSVTADFEEQKSLGNGSITTSYTSVGSLNNPARLIMVANLTNADLQFSTDGATDHFVMAARSSQVFDISANQSQSRGFQFSKKATLYVKEIGNPSSGSVYFSAIYGR